MASKALAARDCGREGRESVRRGARGALASRLSKREGGTETPRAARHPSCPDGRPSPSSGSCARANGSAARPRSGGPGSCARLLQLLRRRLRRHVERAVVLASLEVLQDARDLAVALLSSREPQPRRPGRRCNKAAGEDHDRGRSSRHRWSAARSRNGRRRRHTGRGKSAPAQASDTHHHGRRALRRRVARRRHHRRAVVVHHRYADQRNAHAARASTAPGTPRTARWWRRRPTPHDG